MIVTRSPGSGGWLRWLAVASALLAASCSPGKAAPSSAALEDSGFDPSATISEAGADGSMAMDGGTGLIEGDAQPGDAQPSDAQPGTAPSSDAVADTDVDEAAPGPPSTPMQLSQTGLFKGITTGGTLVLEDGVNEYQPLNPLWSDGAQKTRWIFLPSGTQIDTSDPDHWRFPVGTKFWKEFALNGRRLETRLLWIYGSGPTDFLVAAYWWNPEAGIPDDAALADPFVGAQNVNGTMHDIPSLQDCHACHDSLEEHVLGFGAIELNHTLPGVNVHTLVDAGLLTVEPSLTNLTIPGDATAQAALGYMHTNCGICHNATPGGQGVPSLILRLTVGTATVHDTKTYETAVNQPTTALTSVPYRIAGQEPAESCVLQAMSNRGGREQMPPLATKEVDTTGVAAITAWVNALPKP